MFYKLSCNFLPGGPTGLPILGFLIGRVYKGFYEADSFPTISPCYICTNKMSNGTNEFITRSLKNADSSFTPAVRS